MPGRTNYLPFEQFGPSSRYWLDAFNPDSTLHRFLPCGPVSGVEFPEDRSSYCQTQEETRQLLLESLQSSGLPYSEQQLSAVEKLKDPRCLAIVTGQQPGALGGPLYTFAKILSAIVYAERLEKVWNSPVVPILWNGGDDHDLEEIDNLAWQGPEGDILFHKFGLGSHIPQPAWRVPLSEEYRSAVFKFIEDIHPETEYRKSTLDFLAGLWKESDSWAVFFDRFWLSVFKDTPLLVVRPWETVLRKAARTVMAREIDDPAAYLSDIETDSANLESAGYKPHIHKSRGVCSFFYVDDDGRKSVASVAEGIRIEGQDSVRNIEDLRGEFNQHPDRSSPNALLRPIVQDAILPTAATVLGPTEMAYHAQLGGMYDRHKIPRPYLLPRFSLTLVGNREARGVADLGLDWTNLNRDENELAKSIFHSERIEQSLAVIEEIRLTANSGLEKLIANMGEDGKGLAEPLTSQFKRVEKTISQVEDLIRREESRRDDHGRIRLHKLRNSVFPGGNLQERVFGLAPFLCRFGFDWIGEILEDARDWDGTHAIIYQIGRP